MAFPDETAQKLHQTADYTKKFVDILYPHCEKEPEFTPIVAIE
ncbi:MAG: hypothetical protein WD139_06035 [Balneolaceae bacterium]